MKLSKEECEMNILSEVQTMVNLNHPYLVDFYGISCCDHRLCLVTEYISNGCLLFWLHQQQQSASTKRFRRRRLRLFSLQICDAMDYLQSKSIIHRDLAARNCLIDDNANLVKVSDFSMAKLMSSLSTIYEGKSDTPFPLRWSSPEILFYRQIPFGEFTLNDSAANLIKSEQMPNRLPLANEFIYRQIISPC